MDFGCSWPVWISFFFSLSLSHFIDFYANGSPIWTIIFRFDGVDAAIFAYFEIICGRTFFSVLFCVLWESRAGREGSRHYYSDDIRQKIIWWYKSVCIYPFIYEYVLYINVVNLFIVLLRGWHLRICAIIVWDIEWKVLHHHLANECDFFYHMHHSIIWHVEGKNEAECMKLHINYITIALNVLYMKLKINENQSQSYIMHMNS